MKNFAIVSLALLVLVVVASVDAFKTCSVDQTTCAVDAPVCGRQGFLKKCQLYKNLCTMQLDNCNRFIPFNVVDATYCTNFAQGVVGRCVGLTGLFG